MMIWKMDSHNISPLLFSIYIDELFSKLEYLGLGCHVGLTYAGAFGYADDIALIFANDLRFETYAKSL